MIRAAPSKSPRQSPAQVRRPSRPDSPSLRKRGVPAWSRRGGLPGISGSKFLKAAISRKGFGSLGPRGNHDTSRALEIAQAVSGAGPKAVATGLAFVEETRGASLEQAGRIARNFRQQILEGGDFQERVRKFRAKGKP